MLKLAVIGLGDYGASVASMLSSQPYRKANQFGHERNWVRTRSIIRLREQHDTAGAIGDLQLDFVALTTSMMYQFFHGNSTEMSQQLVKRVRAAAERNSSILEWFPDPYPYVGWHPSGFWQNMSPATMRGMLLAFPEVFQERLSALDEDVDQICLISTSFGTSGSAWIQDVVRMCKESRPRASIRVSLFIPTLSDDARFNFPNALQLMHLRSLFTLTEIASAGVPDSEVFLHEIHDRYQVSFDQIDTLTKHAFDVASRQFGSNEGPEQRLDLRRKLIELGESEIKTLYLPIERNRIDAYRTMPSANYSV